MLQRKAMQSLISWKRSKTRQAAMVTGARQVGKTFLIREFAKKNYEHFVEINLVENAEARAAFRKVQTSNDFLTALSLFAGNGLVRNKTLVFIDEVQESKELVSNIKFLVDRGDYDYILSGSLLGIELNDIQSVPVGYLRTIEMFPLDFEEYCWARGVGHDIWQEVRSCFVEKRVVPDIVHTHLLKLFHEFLVIGGMPDPVSLFISDFNIQNVRQLQSDIIKLYKRDATKYNKKSARAIKRIYDLMPSELNRQNKKFMISSVDGNPRFSRYEEDFLWLVDANIAIAVYSVDEPRYPLMLSAGSTQFKLFLSDVGLLSSMCKMDATRETLVGNVNVNYGSLYENVAAQELKAHGYTPYYFKNRNYGELDYVIDDADGKVIPIEIKSGKNYKRHSALSNVINSPNNDISHGYVFCESNLAHTENVTYCPSYMLGCLEK